MSTSVVLIDLFGVLYTNSFTPWVMEKAATRLRDFISQKKEGTLPFSGLLPHKYPEYYFELVKQNDELHAISDEDFYKILSEASGESKTQIYEMIHGESINPLIVSFVEQLQNAGSYTIVLASASGRKIVTELVGRSRLHFDRIFSAAELGMRKSTPEFYQHIAEVLQVPVDEMLLIDDGTANIEAAKLAGVHAFLYTPAVSAEELLRHA